MCLLLLRIQAVFYSFVILLAAHWIFWHGDFLGVLRRGVSGVSHPPHQNQTEAATQPGTVYTIETQIPSRSRFKRQEWKQGLFIFHTFIFPLPFSIQSSMNRMAIQALEKMETRKFKAKVKGQRESSCGALDSLSSSSTSDCAICLEKYIDGEVKVLCRSQVKRILFCHM